MANVDLLTIFHGLQSQMITKLTANREILIHPGTKGDATELCWRDMLNTYLPERYQTEKAFVLDSNGHISDQIDIVIFDRQYSPFLFNQGGAYYVPAESVYAIIEVKQDLSKQEIDYAGEKTGSVRDLARTSVPIPYAGGVYPPKEHFEILAGLVTLGCEWASPSLGLPFEEAIRGLSKPKRLNFGCSLQAGAFKVEYQDRGETVFHKCRQNVSLIFFFLRLLSSLQELGTIPALDVDAYAKVIE